MSFHLHAKVCLPFLFVHLQISSEKFVQKNKKELMKADEQNLKARVVGILFSRTTLLALHISWLKVIGAIDQLSLPSRDFRVDASEGRPPTSTPSKLLS